MATSASQPYIARLGFQDPDRSKDRHGLACEYLYERLIELEVAAFWREYKIRDLRYDLALVSQSNREAREDLERIANSASTGAQKARGELTAAITESFERHQSLHAELLALEGSDGLDSARTYHKPTDHINVPIKSGYSIVGFADVLFTTVLGEVKITRQPAEQVLQQINFYKSHLNSVKTTYILTDYDCSDLQRLTQGSDVKVYRLGQRFEQWLANRSTPATPEL